MKILIDIPDTHDDIITMSMLGTRDNRTRVFTSGFNPSQGNKISFTGDADHLESHQSNTDIEEVVRCRNCIFYELVNTYGENIRVCAICEMVCDPDDFCSYGEECDDDK